MKRVGIKAEVILQLAVCKSFGIHLDGSSAGALQRSLAQYTGDSISERARLQIITVLASKPMQVILQNSRKVFHQGNFGLMFNVKLIFSHKTQIQVS